MNIPTLNISTLNMTLALSLFAGGAAVPLAEAQTPPAERRAHSAASAQRVALLDAGDLLGSDVHNANDRKIGQVDDVVIELGSGHLSHVVIRHGGLLGFGGDRVAIPVDALSMKRSEPFVRVNSALTPEAIEEFERVNAKNWIDIDGDDENWLSSIESSRASYSSWLGDDDPYHAIVRDGKTRSVSGKITHVERVRDKQGREHVTATIAQKNGDDRTLILGPSWYVMSQPTAPMRGANVKVKAVEIPRDEDGSYVATSYTINGERMRLRDDDGAGRWSSVAKKHQSDRYSHHSDRGVALLSSVIGSDATARWDDAGSIEGAVIELNSGRVAMLALDPDENFLGIGDELRVVPWTLVSVGNDEVTIDADVEMLRGSDFTPEDVVTLTSPVQLEPVYGAYGVQVASFERTERDPRAAKWRDYEGDKRIVEAFEKGKEFTYTGTVTAVSSSSPIDRADEMRSITLRTDDGKRTIVLGPDWYVKNQAWDVYKGDSITVSGRTLTCDGDKHHVASKIDLPGSRSVALWNDDDPRWLTY